VTSIDTSATDAHQTERLRVRALQLAWLTIAWNAIEAAVALGAGSAADSAALIGFGLDSTVEVSSAVVVLWQLSSTQSATRERKALQLISASFFILAGWVAFLSITALVDQNPPQSSTVGIALATVSLIVMPMLATAKRRTGIAMGASAVIADSSQTWLCTALSAVLLVGLGANAALGWWWADSVAALAIAAVAVREGRQAWRGDTCCAVASPAREMQEVERPRR